MLLAALDRDKAFFAAFDGRRDADEAEIAEVGSIFGGEVCFPLVLDVRVPFALLAFSTTGGRPVMSAVGAVGSSKAVALTGSYEAGPGN